MDDQTLRLPSAKPVTLRVARAAKVTGLPLTQPQCADVFRRLGLAFTEGAGTLTVTPPSWRFDIALEEDLIEEVARIVGYHELPVTAPLAPVTARVRREGQRHPNLIRRALAGLGYQETINFGFVEERWERELAGNADPIRVLNPIAAPLAVMRSSLIGSLVGVLRTNLARKAGRVRVFEIGRVFRRDPTAGDGPLSVAGVDQPVRVAALAFGAVAPTQWGCKERAVDFYDLKGDVEAMLAPRTPAFASADHPAMHPGRSARVELDGRPIGYLGELHPRWRQAYELPQTAVLFEIELDALVATPVPQLAPLSRQQSAWRDVALVLREAVPHAAVADRLCDDPSGLIRGATLFDVYQPKAAGTGIGSGERSLAYRLELRDDQATLTDERIEAAVAAAVARVQSACGGRLRS
jgi:phenylalanyl-tRNA synthetase beta chain